MHPSSLCPMPGTHGPLIREPLPSPEFRPEIIRLSRGTDPQVSFANGFRFRRAALRNCRWKSRLERTSLNHDATAFAGNSSVSFRVHSNGADTRIEFRAGQ